jgi:hypothetical protein
MLGPISPVAPLPVFEHTLEAKRAQTAAHHPATCPLCQSGTHGGAAPKKPSRSQPQDRAELSPEAQQIIAQLAKSDREVRAHEQAHLAAAAAQMRAKAQVELAADSYKSSSEASPGALLNLLA